ncbi:MAG: hypothetical protein AVDCRST_MAG76-3574, partial [uncultured Acidimicrobiales bacterium]
GPRPGGNHPRRHRPGSAAGWHRRPAGRRPAAPDRPGNGRERQPRGPGRGAGPVLRSGGRGGWRAAPSALPPLRRTPAALGPQHRGRRAGRRLDPARRRLQAGRGPPGSAAGAAADPRPRGQQRRDAQRRRAGRLRRHRRGPGRGRAAGAVHAELGPGAGQARPRAADDDPEPAVGHDGLRLRLPRRHRPVGLHPGRRGGRGHGRADRARPGRRRRHGRRRRPPGADGRHRARPGRRPHHRLPERRRPAPVPELPPLRRAGPGGQGAASRAAGPGGPGRVPSPRRAAHRPGAALHSSEEHGAESPPHGVVRRSRGAAAMAALGGGGRARHRGAPDLARQPVREQARLPPQARRGRQQPAGPGRRAAGPPRDHHRQPPPLAHVAGARGDLTRAALQRPRRLPAPERGGHHDRRHAVQPQRAGGWHAGGGEAAPAPSRGHRHGHDRVHHPLRPARPSDPLGAGVADPLHRQGKAPGHRPVAGRAAAL